MKKGTLISIEGGEGVGKTTLIENLQEVTKGMDDIVYFSNPSKEMEVTAKIRDILLNDEYSITVETELMLYLCARAELMDKKVRPAMEEGKIVIVDRWHVSTWAYQGAGRNIENKYITMFEHFIQSIVPDHMIILTLDPKEGVRRSLERLGEKGIAEDKFEKEPSEFHKIIHSYFCGVGIHDPKATLIDGTGKKPQQVLQEALTFLDKRKAL